MHKEIKKSDEKLKVLIVDDDEVSTNLLKGVFKSSGFDVKVAFDGLEGFDMATKFLPDVIITGIVMPRMSGFALISRRKNCGHQEYLTAQRDRCNYPPYLT